MRKKLFGVALSLMLIAAMMPSMAFAQTVSSTPITSVNLSITAPQVGATPDVNPTITSNPENKVAIYKPLAFTKNAVWVEYKGTGDKLDTDNYDFMTGETFEAGKTYAVGLYFKCTEESYTVEPTTAITINNQTPNILELGKYDSPNEGNPYIIVNYWDLPAATTPDGGTTQPTTTTDKPSTDKPSTDKPVSDKSPATGDNADMAIWIALMAIAAVAGTGTVLYRRKNTVK